jgi:heat-inducible transcriptional repressor
MATTLTQREEVLLRTLIERYISDGQPVGSRTLARDAGLDVSPATVRNVMADLEEMGLVQSPHTSAGRVPTQAGYRLFVDALVKVQPLAEPARRLIQEQLGKGPDPQALLQSASTLLSKVTRLAGLVTIPGPEQVSLVQLEFVPLSRDRILVILVTRDGRVQNRVITTERTYSRGELVEAANFFNDTYAGVALHEVKRRLLAELERDGEHMQRITRTAVEMARKMFDEDAEHGEDLVVSGESNLFDFPDWTDIQTLRSLFDAFKAKQDLLHLLDKSMRANGLQIFIGEESGYWALIDCSVIAAPYQVDGTVVGTLAVVGPTRISYDRVIPIVDITARLLGSALQARA